MPEETELIERAADPTLDCLSIDLYRAVFDDDVGTPDELRAWLQTHDTGALTHWKPAPVRMKMRPEIATDDREI